MNVWMHLIIILLCFFYVYSMYDYDRYELMCSHEYKEIFEEY